MDQLDRYRPEEWSRDGVTTIVSHWAQPRHFARRRKEGWIARTAQAAALISVVAFAVPSSITVPRSEFIHRAAVVDLNAAQEITSAPAEVEPGHWRKLIAFLDRYPRDEVDEGVADPDPIT